MFHKMPKWCFWSEVFGVYYNEVAAIDVSIGDCVSANLIRLYFPSLRIYARPMLGALSEDISSGSTEISAIY